MKFVILMIFMLICTASALANPAALCDDGEHYTCTDSDSGQDYFTQGAASGLYSNYGDGWQTYLQVDYCQSEDTLVEHTCIPGRCSEVWPSSETVTCENGCENGACKDNEVPEFGLVAAGVAVAGAVAGFFILRKK